MSEVVSESFFGVIVGFLRVWTQIQVFEEKKFDKLLNFKKISISCYISRIESVEKDTNCTACLLDKRSHF
jgi:hypothetical protein